MRRSFYRTGEETSLRSSEPTWDSFFVPPADIDQHASDDSGPGGDILEAPWNEEQFDMDSRSRSTLVGTLDFVEGQRGG